MTSHALQHPLTIIVPLLIPLHYCSRNVPIGQLWIFNGYLFHFFLRPLSSSLIIHNHKPINSSVRRAKKRPRFLVCGVCYRLGIRDTVSRVDLRVDKACFYPSFILGSRFFHSCGQRRIFSFERTPFPISGLRVMWKPGVSMRGAIIGISFDLMVALVNVNFIPTGIAFTRGSLSEVVLLDAAIPITFQDNLLPIFTRIRK